MKKIAFTLYALFSVVYTAYSFATEPPAQPTNMQFASIKAYSMVMSFTTATADGYLVLKSDKAITDIPVDGIIYEKGQGLSSCKVMYVGANNIHSVREILEGSEYHFKVFAYNGTGNQINYLQTSPLSDSVMSAPSDAGTYYNTIDSSSGNFIADLHTLINSHTMNTYTPGYANTMVPVLYERDTTNGQTVVNCEYSNETTIYTPPFSFVTQQYNREHTLCKSWMQTAALYGASNLINYPEGADYFNLLLTRATPNQVRSNHPEGIVVNVSSTYGESKFGTDNNGNPVFEPKDNRKGDAARAMMYEMICYDGLNGGWGLNELLTEAINQDQNILKLWNQQDPPDKFERTKNEYISSLQHNRNPFIDHPAWATCINFDSIIKTNFCGAISGIKDDRLNVGVNIYPNPSNEKLTIDLMDTEFNEGEISVLNIYGAEVFKSQMRNMKREINTENFETGNYLLKISANGKSAFGRFLIIH